ncbi:MAG: hypothetical protein WBA57_00730 [Elainellaceae cyanobacterium]
MGLVHSQTTICAIAVEPAVAVEPADAGAKPAFTVTMGDRPHLVHLKTSPKNASGTERITLHLRMRYLSVKIYP